jgi:hypothetical protein
MPGRVFRADYRNVSPSISELKSLGFKGLWGVSQGDAVSPLSPESNMRSCGGKAASRHSSMILANTKVEVDEESKSQGDALGRQDDKSCRQVDAFHRKLTVPDPKATLLRAYALDRVNVSTPPAAA